MIFNVTKPIRYVIESGESGGFHYDKFSDGTIECYGSKNLTFAAASSASGGIYRSSQNIDVSSLVTEIYAGTAVYNSIGIRAVFNAYQVGSIEIILYRNAAISQTTADVLIWFKGKAAK